jgi:hypothetical protein
VAIAVIGVIGVLFAGMGVYALAAPAALIRPFGTTLGERRRDRRSVPSMADSGSQSRAYWRTR